MALTFPSAKVWIRTWEVQVGRTRLYLLHTNDPANPANVRAITSELYGGGPELRLKQEVLLGIIGWRFLCTLGIRPDVCHLNEGHAAFAVLERAREYMERTSRPFHEALAITRAGNVFTTHTAVDAGFDRFSPELMRHHLSNYAQNMLGISMNDLLALGGRNPQDDSEPFNMAYLAIRGHLESVLREALRCPNAKDSTAAPSLREVTALRGRLFWSCPVDHGRCLPGDRHQLACELACGPRVSDLLVLIRPSNGRLHYARLSERFQAPCHLSSDGPPHRRD